MRNIAQRLSAALSPSADMAQAGGTDPARTAQAGGTDSARALSKQQETVFAGVVDARSSAFQVPAIIVDCRVKKVKNFYKMAGFALDCERGGLWFETIGQLPALQALGDKMKCGSLVVFSKLNIKKSAYHSGGRCLDLKAGTTVSGLPPVRVLYKDLQLAGREGFACNSKIALLQGLRRGQKADVLGKVTSVTVKDLKDGSVSWQLHRMCYMRCQRCHAHPSVITSNVRGKR